jgi:hypothetical protein
VTNDEIASGVIEAHLQQHPLGADFVLAVKALHKLAADLPDPQAKAVIGGCLQQLLKLQAQTHAQVQASSRTRQALAYVQG